MNNISNNSYSNNLYEKLLINQKGETEGTQEAFIPNDIMKNIPNEELIKLDKVQQEMVDSFLRRIKQNTKIAEQIAIKIAKGETVTKEEIDFISKKHPKVKQIVDQELKECNKLKHELRNCNTQKERQQLITTTLKKIENMLKKGMISEVEAKIKTTILEKAIDFNKKILNENKKSEIISVKIIKGEKLTIEEQSFMSEKYPEIKKEGITTDIYDKLKIIALEDVKVDYKAKMNENELKYNINHYLYLKLLSEKSWAIIAAIALISMIYFLGKAIA